MTLDLGTYSSRVLDLYSQLPDTPLLPRRADRQLVVNSMPVPLTPTSSNPPSYSPRLAASVGLRTGHHSPPVRSLAYYLPVLDELLHHPLPHRYTHYLRSKVLP